MSGVESKRILVAMSGGVDSSLSAALLKEQGHDVSGAFIRVWQPPFATCSAQTDLVYAMEVAAELDIPFETIDLEDVYRTTIVDYMIREYAAGRTPNPDVVCNRTIKFGALLDVAIERGYDAVATGHYAQIVQATNGVGIQLLAGADNSKDQSYFLWQLSKEQLHRALFPIGHMQKSEVRTAALKRNLYSANKPDSQGLCFIGKLDMKEFLKEYIPESPGDVLNTAGDKVGHHDGSAFLTLGQRRGFVITQKTPDDPPMYVVAKDIVRNTITVAPEGTGSEPYARASLSLSQTNWIGDEPRQGQVYGVRIRYRQKPIPCSLKRRSNGLWTIELEEPQIVSAGQSAVVYKANRCLGGGVIELPV